MYCPNCGIKLINEDQKFCHNCGSDLAGVFEIIEPTRETYQYREPPVKEIPQTRPIYQKYYQKEVKTSVLTGPYSKKALGYSIVSVGLFIVGIYLGLPIRSLFFYYVSEGLTTMITATFIIIAIVNGVGLMFGIFGTINSKKARLNESNNGMETVGRVFGIIGIVVNIIAFFLVSFVVPYIINIPNPYQI